MPTLFRFVMVLGTIVGVVAGSLYVLAEYFQPEPKEISKALRNVKAEPLEDPNATASTVSPVITAPPSHRAQ
ncbi:MAG: hypothetical protein R3D30_08130 [Hyphomicrobiales bacterium]